MRPVTAYVANELSGTVTPIDLTTNTPGVPIPVGKEPEEIAITPDGKTAYVANYSSGTVTPIDLATNTAGTAILVGAEPYGIRITPDGKTAYVTNVGYAVNSDYDHGYVTPIDLATKAAGTPITVGGDPFGIAITPDGKTAYVTNPQGWMTPIDVATNTAGARIALPHQGNDGIAITPDGKTAYVASNSNPGYVTPIDVATNTVGTPIAVGCNPVAIAITPSRPTAYVFVQCAGGYVAPIDVATNTVGAPITVGGGASGDDGIAITPDGKTAYVANGIAVVPIDLATNTVGTPITVGEGPYNIAITPDTTQPEISPTIDGTLGTNGWYTSDVVISWDVLDPESGIASSSGCGSATLTTDTAGTTLTCTAVNGAGLTATQSVTIKRDATAPVVTYSGNAGTYGLLAAIAINCTAIDGLSGVASSTCANVSGPAWSFGAGPHTLSASATDNAGNTGTGSMTFTVMVTPADLCTLTGQFVHSSSKYQALRPVQKAVVNRLVGEGCSVLTSTRLRLINAYKRVVQALAARGWLTQSQASTLNGLADAL
ncbi:MAG: hypothetical protein ACHQDE_03720 [Acidimicrobiia bacterium]